MNYVDTFIAVAEDCPVDRSVIPESRGVKKSVAVIQYELLSEQRYALTQEDVLFETHLQHKAVPAAEIAARGDQLRAEFFAKPQPCLRSSPLPKQYGWGLHFDEQGKVALYPMQSEEYRRFAGGEEGGPKVLRAMRSRRA